MRYESNVPADTYPFPDPTPVDEPYPCVGKSALFDSTDLRVHAEIKALCEPCGNREDCVSEARRQLRGHWGPVGTWGGVLFGARGRSRPVE